MVGAILSLAQSQFGGGYGAGVSGGVIASINIFGGFAVTHKMLKIIPEED